MALSNAQYDAIMREYEQRQLHNRHVTEKRQQELYRKEPKLKEIEDAIASKTVEEIRKKLEGDTDALVRIQTELADFRREKQRLLEALQLPLDYFEPVYTCRDCRDTGYIGSNKCHCFQQAIINEVYAQSNIRNILERENFSHFSYKYYDNEQIDPTTKLTALQTAEHAVKECRNFVEDFANKPKNLFFYGDTGVGKTFLTNCVAKELLDQGKSVIYFTSFQIFDILSKGIFEKDADAIAAHRNIFDCDLLIIDDLGTELANSFTTSQLFLCVNERILRQKSTIISTNLNISQIMDTYSERTFSRITTNYNMIRLFGGDIRIKKRQIG